MIPVQLWMIGLFVGIFCSVPSYRAYAKPEIATQVVYTQDKTLLKGVRYINPGGTPVLLAHGFMANTTAWKDVGRGLHALGYDVYMFNMRGHGNGDHRSRSYHPHVKSYSFDSIVTQDIPAMLQFVFEKSGRKVNVVGHSMGGMAIRLALSGVHIDQSEVKLSTRHSRLLREMVSKAVFVGSPTTFDNPLSPLMGAKWLSGTYGSFLNAFLGLRKSYRSPLSSKENFFDAYMSFMNMAYEYMARSPFLSPSMTGVINVVNFSMAKQELAKFSQYGVSTVEQELVRDVVRWVSSKIYGSADGRLIYENLPLPARLPFLFVTGELDKVARSSQVFADFNRQVNSQALMVELKGRSHLDLGVGESAGTVLAPLLDGYFANPQSLFEKSLTQKNSLIKIVGSIGSCKNAVK